MIRPSHTIPPKVFDSISAHLSFCVGREHFAGEIDDAKKAEAQGLPWQVSIDMLLTIPDGAKVTLTVKPSGCEVSSSALLSEQAADSLKLAKKVESVCEIGLSIDELIWHRAEPK